VSGVAESSPIQGTRAGPLAAQCLSGADRRGAISALTRNPAADGGGVEDAAPLRALLAAGASAAGQCGGRLGAATGQLSVAVEDRQSLLRSVWTLALIQIASLHMYVGQWTGQAVVCILGRLLLPAHRAQRAHARRPAPRQCAYMYKHTRVHTHARTHARTQAHKDEHCILGPFPRLP
jgi:hypothetical protein